METEMTFAWIPPGTFRMGANGVNDNPEHQVTITKGFFMGIYPVTQAQWQSVMGDNPSKFRGEDRPVEMVTWFQCQEFCDKMGHLTEKSIKLPTEAEWEYACRAGTTTAYYNGNGEEALKAVGWYFGNSGGQTHVVGEKKAANPWGLFDVHGNVWEWCQDWYEPLGSQNQTDPQGQSSGYVRVLRGGCHATGAATCCAANRFKFAPSSRYHRTGVRVCFRLN